MRALFFGAGRHAYGYVFDIGFSLVRSTFVVSKPPHKEGGKWKMTVGGVELTRTE